MSKKELRLLRFVWPGCEKYYNQDYIQACIKSQDENLPAHTAYNVHVSAYRDVSPFDRLIRLFGYSSIVTDALRVYLLSKNSNLMYLDADVYVQSKSKSKIQSLLRKKTDIVLDNFIGTFLYSYGEDSKLFADWFTDYCTCGSRTSYGDLGFRKGIECISSKDIGLYHLYLELIQRTPLGGECCFNGYRLSDKAGLSIAVPKELTSLVKSYLEGRGLVNKNSRMLLNIKEN